MAALSASRALRLLNVAVGLTLTTTGCASLRFGDGTRLSDDFTSYPADWRGVDGALLGPWQVVFAGYGGVNIGQIDGRRVLRLSSAASHEPAETHAAMVVGPEFYAPFDLRVSLLTEHQLRTPSPANPWEVAWLVWNYTDNAHFYYFIAKPNGWELGKRDPAYPGGQRFLATSDALRYPVGLWWDLRLKLDAPGKFSVWVGDRRIVSFTDAERPYDRGRIGVYLEDAVVSFTNLQLR